MDHPHRRDSSAQDCFDLIRLGAALMVLVSHQFALLGLEQPRILDQTLGICGVYIFFVISGFLVVQSWERDPHLLRFGIRRSLRLFPGLIVVVTLTTLLLGPLLTSQQIKQYFSSPDTWSYLSNIAFIGVDRLPGVFEHNPLSNAVNGSLWSLKPEALMYGSLALFGVLLTRTHVYIGLGIAAAWLSFTWFPLEGMDFTRLVLGLGAYFIAGVVLFRLRSYVLNTSGLLGACIVTLGSLMLGQPALALWAVLPLSTLLLARQRPPSWTATVLFGDWSYGVYLWAFPVQQTVVAVGTTSFNTALTMSVLLSLMLAMLSWKFVESPALRLKPKARMTRKGSGFGEVSEPGLTNLNP